MIKFVIQNLEKLGFADEQIYTTIENKMKCGVGKCGRCNVGKDYVCTKGPVYSWAELKKLPEEYLTERACADKRKGWTMNISGMLHGAPLLKHC